jgi:[ribosomal protein S5]-alanine N-acetyltransferase
MIVFETERLIVRHFAQSDADNFFLLQGNPDVMRFIRPVKSREESDAFLLEAMTGYAEPWMGRWAIEEKSTGRFVGSFVVNPIPDDNEKTQLGYAFIPECWGKGLATEVTKAGLEYFYYKTPLQQIFGVVEAANHVSQKVLLKTGFQPFDAFKEGDKEIIRFIFIRAEIN